MLRATCFAHFMLPKVSENPVQQRFLKHIIQVLVFKTFQEESCQLCRFVFDNSPKTKHSFSFSRFSTIEYYHCHCTEEREYILKFYRTNVEEKCAVSEFLTLYPNFIRSFQEVGWSSNPASVERVLVFAHDEVNVHCSPAKKVFFSTIVNFIMSAF